MTETVTRLSSAEVKELLEAHKLFEASEGSEGKRLDLTRFEVHDFCFDGLNLTEVVAQNARFHKCSFRGVVWSSGNFDTTTAIQCDFTDAVLVKAEFFESNLSGSEFVNANLTRAELIDCDLRDVDFTGAAVKGALISESQIAGARFDTSAREEASFEDNRG
ncbi:MAG: pentapeptide repeat-containing protein [Myxococcota bacterium]|nr:pentapeptide repeat-containing protein [Myxococcota bacterium]